MMRTHPQAKSPPARPASGGRIAIAMSGGVDSSVAAALLVQQGHEVVGVHMKLNDLPDAEKHNRACCSLDDSLDARQACARLGIPFYVVNFVDAFERQVIDYFVNSYGAGQTPNPCVMCNRTIKSALLLECVREFGCDTLATGHYARVTQNPDTGEFELRRPRDLRRDQTYFLFGTPRETLPYLSFPLADYEKPAARRIAEGLNLATWNKPDSQEVCFVPKDYREFLRRRSEAAPPPGDFVDASGNVLGRHQGLPYYTIGQRRGLGVGGGQPYYVVALDTARNAVVLGNEEALYGSGMLVRDTNWVSRMPPTAPLQSLVKIRYAHEGTPATLTPLEAGEVHVRFHEPVRAITPGQAAAFYEGDVLLGGGWIVSGAEAG
jgi:tRNA-specific 2-thiouridylase